MPMQMAEKQASDKEKKERKIEEGNAEGGDGATRVLALRSAFTFAGTSAGERQEPHLGGQRVARSVARVLLESPSSACMRASRRACAVGLFTRRLVAGAGAVSHVRKRA